MMKKLLLSILLGFILLFIKASVSSAYCPDFCLSPDKYLCYNNTTCFDLCADCPDSGLSGQFDCSYTPLLGCNEYTPDTTCKQGFKSTEAWCNTFDSDSCEPGEATIKSCLPISPPGTCRCSANYPDFECKPDENGCAFNYTATCSTFLGCNGICECVAPTPTNLPPTATPTPVTYWCDRITFPEEACVLHGTDPCPAGCDPANCDQFSALPGGGCDLPHRCVCEEPTPTSSAPGYCAGRCGPEATPPNPYPNFQYAQCFTVDMPDLPTPGVWDCWNTDDDCTPDAEGDCYCCLHPVLSPPAPITERPILNPITTCPDNKQGIQTAIGCIPLGDQNDFLAFILRWALGIAGGIAFVLIVYAGFLYMTSGGDKQKITAAKELLTAAISGLLLLIFSVFVLDLLGVRILQIPGLK